MEVIAQHRSARIAPRKVRLIREVVRGLSASQAEAQLKFMPGKAAFLVRKVLQSAVANARHNHDIAVDTLRVADIIVDAGFTLKRSRPVSRGMAHPILKRSSHISVVVVEAGTTTRRRVRRAKRKTEIKTLSPEQLIEYHEDAPTEAVSTKKGATTSGAAAETRTQSKTEEAFQLKKMQQQGGDRAKTHRRKSMSG